MKATNAQWPSTIATCQECHRGFDLAAEVEAGEWFYGHDCESSDE